MALFLVTIDGIFAVGGAVHETGSKPVHEGKRDRRRKTPLFQKRVPKIDTEVMRFAFGDLLYDMTDSEKSELRRQLAFKGKNIGARKLRMAVNASLGSDTEKKKKLREMYVGRASYPQKMIGKLLMMTVPEVATVAKAYFSNAQDYYTVGQIAEIADMVDQQNNISQSISRFRKHRQGIIRVSQNSGLSLEAVDIGGRAGSAYRFRTFGPIIEGHEEADLIFVVQPAELPSLNGNVKEVYNQIGLHKNRGAKTIFHRTVRKESIAIYKVKDGSGRWTDIELTEKEARVRHVDAPANTK